MTQSPKPYRRFRARGSADAGGIEELRRLTEAERGASSADAPRNGTHRPPVGPTPRGASAAPAPTPPPVLDPDEVRRRRRALERAGRPWWSFRGLGPAGIVRRGAVVLLVACAVWAVAGYLALRGAVGDSNDRVQRDVPSLLARSDGMLSSPTDILVVGSDARPGETRSRADTIMVMRLDPDAGRIKYLSIPRDFRVYLGPRLGHEKINASFQYGGQSGIVKAVRRLTGLPIHHIMVVNFRGFPRLVDELGGVTVYNPTALTRCPYPGGRFVSFPKGRISLDGDEALVFARVRKCDTDFQRAARQQALVGALQKKVLSVGSLWKAPWNGAAVVRAITTDMGVDELAKLGWLQARLDQRPDDRIVLSGESQTIGGISYVVGDPTEDLDQIRRFVS